MKSIFALVALFLSTCHLNGDEYEKELFITFYPAPFVFSTLEKYAIAEDDRSSIIEGLSNQELDVVVNVELLAEQMNPNPLKVGDQKEIVKLFDCVVLQVFKDVMYQHGITNDDDIASMIKDIHQQKADRFRQCMQAPV